MLAVCFGQYSRMDFVNIKTYLAMFRNTFFVLCFILK